MRKTAIVTPSYAEPASQAKDDDAPARSPAKEEDDDDEDKENQNDEESKAARDRRIGMIQPRSEGQKPALFDVGCLGRISHIEALDDGRFNIILTGLARFKVVRELPVTTQFRQIEADVMQAPQEDEVLHAVERAALEQESRRFADALGYVVDWTAVSRLDDMALVNGIAQIAPFDAAAKQTLLEADTLGERSERIIQLMQIFGRIERDGGATMQ